MKKKLLIIAILSLNLLALVTDGKCSLGTVTATAQSLGSENENDKNTRHFDPFPDTTQVVLPEIIVNGTNKKPSDTYENWGYSVGNVTYGGSSDTGIGEDSNQGSNNNGGTIVGGSSGGTNNGGVTVEGGSGSVIYRPVWDKDTTNWTDQEKHPDYYKPTDSEKVLNFNIPKQWDRQSTKNDCVPTTMEYIANYYWGTVNAGYSPMRDMYDDDCINLFGYDPRKYGVQGGDIYDLMKAENFSCTIISSNQIDANIDAGNPIFVVYPAKQYDDQGNPRTVNHASMLIGYNKNNGTCLVVDPANGTIQQHSPNEFILNIAVTYPYVKLKTK